MDINDICTEIFRWLPLRDLAICRRVCKRWNALVDLEAHYERFCEELCPGFPAVGSRKETLQVLIGLKRTRETLELTCSLLQIYKMEDLYLGGKCLNPLDPSIGNLVNLTKLDLLHNNLRRLPDSIGNLINLEELYVDHNELEEVCTGITRLFNLKMLNLSYNCLFELCDGFSNLTKLEWLCLSGNPKFRSWGSIKGSIERKFTLSFRKESIPANLVSITHF